MKLCPIFLFHSSSPPTIPNPHHLPYSFDGFPQHSILPPSPFPLPALSPLCHSPHCPSDSMYPDLSQGMRCWLSGQCSPPAWPAGNQTWQITAGLRLLPLSSSRRKSPAQHCLGSFFLLQMLLFTVSDKIAYLRATVCKTCYINHQWIKEVTRSGMG